MTGADAATRCVRGRTQRVSKFQFRRSAELLRAGGLVRAFLPTVVGTAGGVPGLVPRLLCAAFGLVPCVLRAMLYAMTGIASCVFGFVASVPHVLLSGGSVVRLGAGESVCRCQQQRRPEKCRDALRRFLHSEGGWRGESPSCARPEKIIGTGAPGLATAISALRGGCGEYRPSLPQRVDDDPRKRRQDQLAGTRLAPATAQKRSSCQRLGGAVDDACQPLSMHRYLLLQVIRDVFQIGQGGFGPAQLHQALRPDARRRSKRSPASAWLIIRPDSRSARPSWTSAMNHSS